MGPFQSATANCPARDDAASDADQENAYIRVHGPIIHPKPRRPPEKGGIRTGAFPPPPFLNPSRDRLGVGPDIAAKAYDFFQVVHYKSTSTGLLR